MVVDCLACDAWRREIKTYSSSVYAYCVHFQGDTWVLHVLEWRKGKSRLDDKGWPTLKVILEHLDARTNKARRGHSRVVEKGATREGGGLKTSSYLPF